jgi:hypothetical protein
MLLAGQLCQLGAMGFQQIAEFIQDAAAPQWSCIAPAREGCFGGFNCIRYIVAAGQRYLTDDFAGRRIGYVRQTAAAALGALTIDPQRQY